ncbi:MAG: hypothetical protein K9M03_02530 [Kiritimatiellales bacterium]|nr:hypothetical protein [Kiritimatiellales bacterium]
MNCIYFFVGLVASSVSATALAAGSDTACAFVGDCGPVNALGSAIAPIGNMLVAIAAGLSVLFVVVGGALMLISAGDEGQVQKGKMSIVYSLVGLGIVLISQSFIAFIGAQFGGLMGSADPVFDFMKFAVRAMVVTFNAVFLLMMIGAGFRMAFARGSSDEFTKARGMLIWAVAGAITVNIASALVNAVMTLPF